MVYVSYIVIETVSKYFFYDFINWKNMHTSHIIYVLYFNFFFLKFSRHYRCRCVSLVLIIKCERPTQRNNQIVILILYIGDFLKIFLLFRNNI
jgi:hypothetical protein